MDSKNNLDDKKILRALLNLKFFISLCIYKTHFFFHNMDPKISTFCFLRIHNHQKFEKEVKTQNDCRRIIFFLLKEKCAINLESVTGSVYASSFCRTSTL